MHSSDGKASNSGSDSGTSHLPVPFCVMSKNSKIVVIATRDCRNETRIFTAHSCIYIDNFFLGLQSGRKILILLDGYSHKSLLRKELVARAAMVCRASCACQGALRLTSRARIVIKIVVPKPRPVPRTSREKVHRAVRHAGHVVPPHPVLLEHRPSF